MEENKVLNYSLNSFQLIFDKCHLRRYLQLFNSHYQITLIYIKKALLNLQFRFNKLH
jgi:hypothetical protein